MTKLSQTNISQTTVLPPINVEEAILLYKHLRMNYYNIRYILMCTILQDNEEWC